MPLFLIPPTLSALVKAAAAVSATATATAIVIKKGHKKVFRKKYKRQGDNK